MTFKKNISTCYPKKRPADPSQNACKKPNTGQNSTSNSLEITDSAMLTLFFSRKETYPLEIIVNMHLSDDDLAQILQLEIRILKLKHNSINEHNFIQFETSRAINITVKSKEDGTEYAGKGKYTGPQISIFPAHAL